MFLTSKICRVSLDIKYCAAIKFYTCRMFTLLPMDYVDFDQTITRLMTRKATTTTVKTANTLPRKPQRLFSRSRSRSHSSSLQIIKIINIIIKEKVRTDTAHRQTKDRIKLVYDNSCFFFCLEVWMKTVFALRQFVFTNFFNWV